MKKIRRLSNKKTALLVIDMQNDFVSANSFLKVPGIAKHLPRFKKFIDRCRAAGLPVIFTRHVFSPKNNPVEAVKFPQLSKRGLRQGTNGFQICRELTPTKDDKVINKTRYDAFYRTDLEKFLRRRKISNVLIAGALTNVCCESTARTAMTLDFFVYFISDLTFTYTRLEQAQTLANMAGHFGWVKKSVEII